MTGAQTLVIVGASVAAANAQESLREARFDGRLALTGDEEQRPLRRPPLSKDCLRGETGVESIYQRLICPDAALAGLAAVDGPATP